MTDSAIPYAPDPEAMESRPSGDRRWLGAVADLGLQVHWRNVFVAPGAGLLAQRDGIILDVGGVLAPGIIDHHQPGALCGSTAELLTQRSELAYAHLMDPWLDVARLRDLRGALWRPVIITHESPDLDAVASIAIVKELIEQGAVSPSFRALAGYATRVDQGRILLRNGRLAPSLYALMLTMQGLEAASLEGWMALAGLKAAPAVDARRLALGLELVRLWRVAWTAALQTGGSGAAVDPHEVLLSRDAPLVAKLMEEMEGDWNRFSLGVRSGAARLHAGPEAVDLPIQAADDMVGATARFALGVWSSIEPEHRSSLDKHYLRGGVLGEPAPLTIIRRPVRGRADRWRWVVAVDPAAQLDAPNRPSLWGLGRALEQAELRARGGVMGEENRGRRGMARFAWSPGVSDPWYDGAGHEFTIVDSPRDGSVLDEAGVLRIVRERFWEPEVQDCSVRSWRLDGSSVVVQPSVRAGSAARTGDVRSWIEQHRGGAGNDVAFVFVAVSVNPAWGDDAIRRFMRSVVGGEPVARQVSAGMFYAGPSGAVLDCGSARQGHGVGLGPIEEGVARAVSLLISLRAIDRALGAIDQCPRQVGASKLLLAHVQAVSRYYAVDSGRADLDRATVSDVMHDVLQLDSRVRGVSGLLEHLDDLAERERGARLNVLLVLLSLFGAVQAIAAWLALPVMQDAGSLRHWGPWLIGCPTLLLVALLALNRFSIGRTWLSRLMGTG